MWTRICCAALAAFVAAAPAAAIDDVPLSEYVVTSWTTKDGLPSDVIWSVSQDREGYLWLGTNGGLVRFDGVRFTTIDSIGGTPLPRGPVRTVYVASDGALWIGFWDSGAISRVLNQTAKSYGEQHGLPRTIVTAIAQDRSGRMWAGTSRGLYALNGDRWDAIGERNGLPDGRVDSLYVDRSGNLLVGTERGVYRKAPGAGAFEAVDTLNDVRPTFRGFAEDAGGRVWMTDPLVGFRRLGDAMPPSRGAQRGRGNRLLFDRERLLWVATMGDGLWRIRLGADTRSSDIQKTRLSGARTLFEDRDGNIWAGAGDGLVQLRKPRVIPMTNLGLVEAVATAPDGTVWAATAQELIAFRSNARGPAMAPLAPAGSRIRAIRGDANRPLWVVTGAGLVRVADSVRRFRPLERVDAEDITAIAPDEDGSLWVSDRTRGLTHWRVGSTDTLELADEAAARDITTLYADRQGRVWFASAAGRLGMRDQTGMIQLFGPEQGLAVGAPIAVFEDSRGIVWAANPGSVSRFDGARFVRFTQSPVLRAGAAAVVEDADRDMWFATASGIAFARRSELDRALEDASYTVDVGLFDAADGLAGMPISFGGPAATAALDGRLWFVTGRGLTSLDPRALKERRRPATVRIERVTADERTLPGTIAGVLPGGTSRLQIEYTALDLTTPMRIRFKYRLDGFDADWVDAGTRREALYTSLPPRAYRFHVVASTADGSWRDASTTWEFTVQPRFYRTYWFAALCAVALTIGAWSAWQIRLRRVRRQFALLLGERVRLSREIHDTLLQSMVGVALQFDALASTIDPSSPARHQLVRLRKQVEEYIREARQSIWNLRAPGADARDLAAALRDSAERAATGMPVRLRFALDGEPYAPGDVVSEHLQRICHEAVRNAVRHAGASEVTVDLCYRPDAIVLRVADDGHGFNADVAVAEARGHYGLAIMRERAEQAGGELSLTSSAQTGTIVEARMPVRAAAASARVHA